MEKLMSLQQYVRQLRPRTENYIPPVDKVQNFLSKEVKTENFKTAIVIKTIGLQE